MGIVVENLHKSYGAEDVLNGIDLEIPDRSFFSVVAPTGAGKTTLLRILAGIEPHDSGTIYYDGEDVSKRPVQDRSIGMVYQEFVNYPSLTVRENLASPLEVSDESYSRNEIKRRVDDIAERLQIDHILDHLPEEVSGGEAQRTAISRALIREPDYLFMDEPLANLDYKLREELRSDFKQLFSEQNTTVVYATPEAGDALSMSTHIGFLHNGNIMQDGPADDVYYRPRYLPVAQYLGEPPMNTVQVQYLEENGQHWFQVSRDTRLKIEPFEPLSPGQYYVLGFRPQDMTISQEGASETTIETEISFVETVGSTSTLHINLEDHEFFALNSEPIDFDRGSTVRFGLDPDKFYVFDAESGGLLAQGSKIPGRREPVSRG